MKNVRIEVKDLHHSMYSFDNFQLLEEMSREMETLRNENLKALTALQNCKEFPSQTETELQNQLESLKQEHRSTIIVSRLNILYLLIVMAG